jgi:hypothetical protein
MKAQNTISAEKGVWKPSPRIRSGASELNDEDHPIRVTTEKK